jgi:hypothetical protein
MQPVIKTSLVGTAIVCMVALSAPAIAEEMKFTAELAGAQEVPPVETEATGSADITYDTESMELSWTIEHSGLSGDVTAAHFHGPAAEGENAGPIVPIEMSDLAEGSATLDETQANSLMEGMLYVNLHTAEHPDGEIRGQVMAADQ